MIGRLTGVVAYTDLRYLIVDVSGVGYKISAPGSIIDKARVGEKLTLWTYLAVRENALDLYGFSNKDELEFFELLITVSGIGPKTALGILNITTIATLRQAVSSGETAHLTKVSGIGKKTAEKIVLELRDKLGAGIESDGIHIKDEVDAVEALKSLGYSHNEAREALKKVSKESLGTSEKVKQALKILGNHTK